MAEREAERKGKEEYLYSAFLHQGTHKALRHGSHSFTCKQHHACLSFVSVHQMALPQQLRQQTSNCSLLLIYRLRKDERLSWPGWLTCSGWFTHISGHSSATGGRMGYRQKTTRPAGQSATPWRRHKNRCEPVSYRRRGQWHLWNYSYTLGHLRLHGFARSSSFNLNARRDIRIIFTAVTLRVWPLF